ncbi:dGTPase [Cetobacterium ceti]|uniref:dGTPase n=1 Tax=Cetobacterium ceti TaxID=180163 RepID=A0A1T4R6Y7_9FUSO|nr:dNTP triphosphohydrolase [Cetobacterium ceti]SKA11820.1 dGTPase [Cetobacterium ceti]
MDINEIWDKCLSKKRFKENNNIKDEYDERNEFEKDYSRIISSSSFRRLQDKTQVFPLKRGDFVRTRLTHSLEVSDIGYSMGRVIEETLNRKDQYISSILSVAGLIHDLGNPPFGHSGEYVIQDFFKKFFLNEGKVLSDIQQEDLINFDGNVQTFRILRKLQFLGNQDGFNLTYGTLLTIIKYPFNSLDGNKKRKLLINKKFGYYESEEKDYKKISEELNFKNKRHPLTWLLEAADDIAYCVADIEDGIQKKLITLLDIEKALEKNKDCESVKDLVEKIIEYKEENDTIKENNLFEKIVVQKLKIYIQRNMIQETIKVFLDNQIEILKGTFKKELLDIGKYKKIKDSLKELAYEKIFQSEERIYTDILANKVLKNLLNIFIEGMLDCLNNNEEATSTSKNIKKLISKNYMINYEKELKESSNKSDKIYVTLKVCLDFISGMTDKFAVELYKKLEGII